jgi:hypothetical protein
MLTSLPLAIASITRNLSFLSKIFRNFATIGSNIILTFSSLIPLSQPASLTITIFTTITTTITTITTITTLGGAGRGV